MLRRVFASRVAIAAFTALITGCTVGFVTNGFGWQDSGPEIRACVGPTGLVRIVPPHAMCRRSEHAIEWNQQGPPGPPGAPGAQGQQGPPGATGPQGPAGIGFGNVVQHATQHFIPLNSGYMTFYEYCTPDHPILVEGGYQSTPEVHVINSTPNYGLGRWEVEASNRGLDMGVGVSGAVTTPEYVYVQAVCAAAR